MFDLTGYKLENGQRLKDEYRLDGLDCKKLSNAKWRGTKTMRYKNKIKT